MELIRLGRLTGLPAVLDGRPVGHVEQCILTNDGRFLRGLTVRHGFGSAKWIASDAVLVMGDVSVVVAQKPVKTPKDCDFRLTTVWDTAGLPLGRVTDVYVSPMTHEVKALEVSLGPVETIRTGRCIARTFSVCDALPEAGAVMIPCGYALERPMDGR